MRVVRLRLSDARCNRCRRALAARIHGSSRDREHNRDTADARDRVDVDLAFAARVDESCTTCELADHERQSGRRARSDYEAQQIKRNLWLL